MKSNPPERKIHRTRGVTLVEMAIVMTVGAILASTAAPGMRGLIDTRRLEGAAAQLATDVHYGRSEAVARNQPVRLSFQAITGGSCYVIHTGLAAQCVCGPAGAAVCSGDAVHIKTVQLAQDNRVALQANAASLLFDPLHGTSTPTGTLRLTGADGRAVHHVVNVMGRVRSCSPSGAMPGYRAC